MSVRHISRLPVDVVGESSEESQKEYVMQVDLESNTRGLAEQEAEALVVIPHETLNNLITLLEGRMLNDGESIASTIKEVKEYM